MAGHVLRRVLRKPEVHQCLLDGTVLFKSNESSDVPIEKLTFYSDKDAYFLWAQGNDKNKSYDNLIWDIQFISDVRTGKPPKDSKLTDESTDDLYLTLVYRLDGIVNLEFISLLAQSPEVADTFKKSVNALTANMLHAHAAPQMLLKKQYLKIKLHANGKGQIPLKSINRLMMVRYTTNNFLIQWLAQFGVVKDSEDGKTQFVRVEDFTEDLFFKMVDQLLNNRTNDIDTVFSSLVSKSKKTAQLSLKDFHHFLNSQQRDPRLNEILHPFTSKDQCSKIIARYERGKSDRLSSKGLIEYLMSEENNILDLEYLNQTHDMGQPLNHYFINSSHNTYLTGHQLRSSSTAEMYIQCLLLGCRCVELDCWPENDTVIITHGGTFCGKVAFEEVVAAIAEFAFVTSEYPVILSIENHCRKHPHLMQHMANTFRLYFGDKLLSQQLDGYPLEPGVPLPPPEMLKGKILIKDKLLRKKGDGSYTLTRGASILLEDEGGKKTVLDSDSPMSLIPEEPKSVHSESSSENASEVKPSTPDSEENTDGKPEEKVEPDTTKEASKEEVKEEPKEEVKDESKQNGAKEEVKGSSESNSSDSNGVTKQESQEGPLFPIQRELGPDGPDITTINVALIHQRPSEVEGISTGPLAEILNYTTGISFDSFQMSEKANLHFQMSSFVEEKGLNHIKTKPKEFVKYNMRQNSRIYPQGARINSSNYMPVIYWNVGCQMVALNFQTSDLPVQTNTAKFQFNGMTGYHLKPWVMNREGAKRGIFNPFVQTKLEDIVPAKLQIKIISGYFLTSSEKTKGCYVEVDIYGLPADTKAHKYYTKKVNGPHPFWNEDYFTFKRILLPELALLRIAVFDEDKEQIGMRVMPLNSIRPGFRHVGLRDKHNAALPLEMIFVHIKVEDWVPDEMEDFVAMLMDPISFAKSALKELAEGLDASEAEFGAKQPGLIKPVCGEDEEDGGEVNPPRKKKPTPNKTGPSNPFGSPGGLHAMGAGPLPLQLSPSTAYSSASLTRKPAGVEQTNRFFDVNLMCLDVAKNRPPTEAIQPDSKEVIGHGDFKKLDKKHSQFRATMLKKQEKSEKQLRDKIFKGKEEESELQKLEKLHKIEILNFNKTCSSERYVQKRTLIETAHKAQMMELKDKIQKSDIANMSKELASTMKKSKKDSEFKKENRKQSIQEIEDRIISLGKKARNEFEKIHSAELTLLEESQKRAKEQLVKIQAKELDQHNEELSKLDGEEASP